MFFSKVFVMYYNRRYVLSLYILVKVTKYNTLTKGINFTYVEGLIAGLGFYLDEDSTIIAVYTECRRIILTNVIPIYLYRKMKPLIKRMKDSLLKRGEWNTSFRHKGIFCLSVSIQSTIRFEIIILNVSSKSGLYLARPPSNATH